MALKGRGFKPRRKRFCEHMGSRVCVRTRAGVCVIAAFSLIHGLRDRGRAALPGPRKRIEGGDGFSRGGRLPLWRRETIHAGLSPEVTSFHFIRAEIS